VILQQVTNGVAVRMAVMAMTMASQATLINDTPNADPDTNEGIA